jgi:hypothetical protein
MSSGTLLQLVAKGAEDIYLTGKPEMTFFKSVYRKHTNFSQETNKVKIPKSNLSYTNETKCSVVVPRNGDLLSNIYLGFTTPHIFSNNTRKFRWIQYLGNNFIEKVTIFINGQNIDELTGDYLTIDNELNLTDDKKKLYYELIGHEKELYEPNQAFRRNGFYPISSLDSTDNLNYNKPPSIESRTIYVPLSFWFCKNTGLAIPLVALQKSEIRLEFTFKPLYKLYQLYNSTTKKYIQPDLANTGHSINNFMSATVNSGTALSSDTDYDFDLHVECSYIHLDNPERQLFASKSHNYLIKNVRKISETNITPGVVSINIKASHPVLEMIITGQRTDYAGRNDYNNYTNWSTDVPEWQQVSFLPESNKIAGTIEITQNTFWDYTDGSQNTIRFSRDSTSGALLIEKYYSGQYNTIFRFDSDAETNPALPDAITNVNHSQYYENQTRNIIKDLQIYFDGKQKLTEDTGRPHEFFTKLQPYQYHRGNSMKGLFVYSFSLNPWDDVQPSGSVNLTRVDNLLLKMNTILPKQTVIGIYDYKFNINIYLISYNIFNITGGMAGLKFAK